MQELKASIAGILPNVLHEFIMEKSEAVDALNAALPAVPLTAEWIPLMNEVESTIEALPTDSHPTPDAMKPALIRINFCITRHRFSNGDAFTAIASALRAMAIARTVKDGSLLAKAANNLGSMYMETANFPDAVSALGTALEAARSHQNHTLEAAALSNLGLAHQHAGHFAEAIPCFEAAVQASEFDGETGANVRAISLANVGLASIHLRDYARGIDALEQAIELLHDPRDANENFLRASAEFYLTRILLEVRNLDSARAHADLAREFAEKGSDLSLMMADLAQGLVECYQPISRDIGLSRLQRVVNHSRKGTATTLRDALSAIVRGYEIAGQPNSALVYLHEASQLNRTHRVANILRHHRSHLAAVGRNRHLDDTARRALDSQEGDLRFQRLSMDALHECMQVLEKNTVAAEMHDDETGEHCYRVGALARDLARAKGMDEEMCTLIDLSARLHDIGKLRVPDSILLKPGRFTAEERAIMEKHCEHGWELIGEGGLAQLFVAQEIALNHHERWDGTGYPNHRKGNMIPLAARVTALADVFDALTHQRCYKFAWSVDEALREIGRLRGTHFDPELTDLFLELVPALQACHGDLDRYLGAEARHNDFIAGRRRLARELKSNLGTFDIRR
jgi:HD-GYP domain-containing protein (c-di-GMP phosphodiesterase class II)